ncbi:class I SAM-dependent methyltransferase [Corallococcus praedator]|uniref:Class I SAM-dependent methyltransferase n=1 Tax=Corallococcus praedator TaxID=2316724 RepID=A0ABX9QFV9_9BACT|nr:MULTISPECIES: class I SAM-dependent methyltransferase [Corallococcus]RKH28899.1 class I SAM-dependent methyltransferase [Corallococcus sp. CA031C]RKI03205.1 class I SAM-dependent methyltransferase [Corallococcus praedator]
MADLATAVTERLLIDAGIREGMRVLDVGCGRGLVSLLLARLVGARGQVVGVDIDSRSLAVARETVQDARITFVEGDFRSLSSEHGLFDAAVGRRVLMYQPDAVEALRGLARVLRPRGLMAFQEHDSTVAPTSLTPLPLHEKVRAWMWRTVEREGGNVHMGFGLASALTRAGLTVEQVRAEAIVQTPAMHHPVGAILRAMLPRILERGVATEEELGIDTIDARLIEERTQADATYIGEMVFGAWARLPR